MDDSMSCFLVAMLIGSILVLITITRRKRREDVRREVRKETPRDAEDEDS
jgi:hypothetical protein